MAQPHSVIASGNFLVPNATFIAEFVVFLLILAIIWRWIVPPVKRAMDRRQDMIRQQGEDADEAKRQLAEAERRFQQALTEARTEAAQIRENARAEAQRTLEDLRQQAQEESERIRARGEEQLASQRSAIVRELRAEIGTLAVELAEKIVDQRLAEDDQVSATVDAFLAGLESRETAATTRRSTGG
jgi:F-type H+-transporting ATPase subunit b